MKLTIFRRLVISYLVIIVLTVCLGIYTVLRLNQLSRIINYIISVDNITIKLAEELTDTLFTQIGFEEKYLISKDQDFYQHFWKTGDYFIENLEKLEYMADTSEKKRLITEIKEAHNDYCFIFKSKASLSDKDNNKFDYKKYQEKREVIIDKINHRLRKIAELTRLDRDDKIQMASNITFQVTKVTAFTVCIAIVMVVLMSLINTRSINRPILILREKTKEVAKGKFSQTLDISSPPEIEELAASFNIMCKRLSELDAMKIDFIGHVSHQLGTPLAVIREASSMLLEGTFKNSPEKQYELFSIIKDECERLINSVNRILVLSRMEAGMMDYNFKTYNIASIVQKSTTKLTPLAQKKKIGINVNMAENLPLIKIDEEKIVQVIEELLNNAIKYTPDGGRIDVSVSTDSKDNTITVSVADTGCGIPEEGLEMVFDKFKRIDNGWAAERGTGLGLSIVKHIITAHGGKIWVESKLGEGSTFYFTLPIP